MKILERKKGAGQTAWLCQQCYVQSRLLFAEHCFPSTAVHTERTGMQTRFSAESGLGQFL
jgi:hypothetical protein